jgi:hypothetical protein
MVRVGFMTASCGVVWMRATARGCGPPGSGLVPPSRPAGGFTTRNGPRNRPRKSLAPGRGEDRRWAGPDRAALEAERTALRGRRAVQLRLHAEGSIDDDELKTALETFGARLAVISAELENTGRHSVLTGIAGRPDAAQVWDGLTLGLRREVIRACCEDPPVVFLPGKPPDVFNPELIKLNIKGTPGTVRPVRVHRAPSRRRGRVPKNA